MLAAQALPRFANHRSWFLSIPFGIIVAFAGCGDDTMQAGGSGGAAGIGGAAGAGGSGGSLPTTATVRIINMNPTVGLVDVTDANDPDTVILPLFQSGTVTQPLNRQAGVLSFDFRGPGVGDLRFSTGPQTLEAGKEYLLVLLPDPSSMMSNANQTVTIEVARDSVDPGDAGLVLVHGSANPDFETTDITLQLIDGFSESMAIETGVGIGTRTAIQSVAPAEYAFTLFSLAPIPTDPPFIRRARRTLAAGEFVVAIAGEGVINEADVSGWFALSVDDVTMEGPLELLEACPSACSP